MHIIIYMCVVVWFELLYWSESFIIRLWLVWKVKDWHMKTFSLLNVHNCFYILPSRASPRWDLNAVLHWQQWPPFTSLITYLHSNRHIINHLLTRPHLKAPPKTLRQKVPPTARCLKTPPTTQPHPRKLAQVPQVVARTPHPAQLLKLSSLKNQRLLHRRIYTAPPLRPPLPERSHPLYPFPGKPFISQNSLRWRYNRQYCYLRRPHPLLHFPSWLRSPW